MCSIVMLCVAFVPQLIDGSLLYIRYSTFDIRLILLVGYAVRARLFALHKLDKLMFLSKFAAHRNRAYGISAIFTHFSCVHVMCVFVSVCVSVCLFVCFVIWLFWINTSIPWVAQKRVVQIHNIIHIYLYIYIVIKKLCSINMSLHFLLYSILYYMFSYLLACAMCHHKIKFIQKKVCLHLISSKFFFSFLSYSFWTLFLFLFCFSIKWYINLTQEEGKRNKKIFCAFQKRNY